MAGNYNNILRYQVQFDVQKKNLKELEASLKEIQNLKISDVMKINSVDANTARTTLANIKLEAQQIQSALKRAFNTKLNTVNIKEFQNIIASSVGSIDQLHATFSNAGAAGQSAFRNLTTTLLTTNAQLKKSHEILDQIGTTLANTIKWTIASSAVQAVSSSVEQAWGYVKKLDTSLNDIRIVTNKSADEMSLFAEKANAAAQALGKTTVDYTNAALIYQQQGLNDAEVEARTKVTLMTANVTKQAADKVSEELTSVWNGYKVTAQEAQEYVDRLAAVAAHSASNLAELSTGMSKVASAANALGVSESQLAAQLSTVISATRQAPQTVGTALRTVYARITDIQAGISEDQVSLGRFSGKLAALGFNVLDVNGELRDMGQVIEEIGAHWSELTREQQVYLAQTMAGTRQYSNLIALFDNFEHYNKMLNIAENSVGTLQKQQDVYMESTQAQLKQLKAALENVYDSLINPNNLKSITNILNGLSNVANASAEIIDTLGGGGAILHALGAIALDVFKNQISNSILTVIDNFKIASEQAAELDEKLSFIEQQKERINSIEAGNIQALPNEDVRTEKFLLNSFEALYKSKPMMSNQDFIKAQDTIRIYEQAVNKVQQLAEEQTKVETRLNSLLTKMGYQDDIIQFYNATEDEQQEIIQNFSQMEESFEIYKKVSTNGLKDINKLYREFANQDISKKIKTGNNITSSVFNDTIIKDYSNTIDTFFKQISKFQNALQNSPVSEEFKKQIQSCDDLISKVSELQLVLDKYKQKMESNSDFHMQDHLVSLRLNQGEQAYKKFKTIIESTQQLTKGLGLEFQNAFDNPFPEKMQQSIGKLNGEIKKAASLTEDLNNKLTMRQLVSGISGFRQMTLAISQLQNLGNAKNAFQVISNLAFSLPMLVRGFSNFGTSLKMIQPLSEKAVENLISLRTAAKGAVSDFFVTAQGADGLVASLGSLGAVQISWPGVFVAGLTAVATTIGIVVNKIDQLREAQIQEDKENIDKQNNLQTQLNSYKDLYTSLEELDQKISSNKITRAELKTTIEQLIDQYKLQGETAQQLRDSYLDLADGISKVREKAADELYDSTKREKQLAWSLAQNTLKGGVIDGATYLQNVYSKNLKGDIQRQEKQLQEIVLKNRNIALKEIGSGNNVKFGIEANIKNIDQFIDYYESLQDTIDEITELKKIHENDENFIASINDSKLYKSLTDQLNNLSDAYTKAIESVDNFDAAMINSLASKSNIEFSDVNDFSTYQQLRERLIGSVSKAGKKDQQKATEITDNYIRDYFRQIYNIYDQEARYLDKVKERLKNAKDAELISSVKQQLNNLTEAQTSALVNQVPPEYLSSWQSLLDIIQNISQIDLSNLNTVYDDQDEGPQDLEVAATSTYQKYQSLEDQIRSGKTISKSQFEKNLTPQLQSYFTMMANGSYKMTKNAEQFYEVIESAKLQGFYENLQLIKESFEALEDFQAKNFNYEELLQDNYGSITGVNGGVGVAVNSPIVDKQLDYLSSVYQKNSQKGVGIQALKTAWEGMKQSGAWDVSILQEIADEVKQVGDLTKDAGAAADFLNDKYEEIAHQLHDAMFPTDQDIDTGALQSLAQTLQEISTVSEQLDDNLRNDTQAAEDVAESVLRFDNAIEDLVDNYDDWITALQNGAIGEQATQMEALRDAYADLLDLDGSSLSKSFLTNAENLELFKAVIDGDIEAYDQLLKRAGQDISVQVNLSYDKFQEDLNNLISLCYEGKNSIDDFEIGAKLDDTQFLLGLQNLVNAANMTAQQATDYLATMGVDAEIIENKAVSKETQEIVGSDVVAEENPLPYAIPYVTGNGVVKTTQGAGFISGFKYTPKTETVESTKEGTGFALKVTSAHKSSGGNFKYKNAANGAGGKGQARRAKAAEQAAKSAEKNKASQPKVNTSQKDPKKHLEDDKDIYHDINIEIKKVNRDLQRTQKIQERLFGQDLLDNLNKQTAILQAQKEQLLEKQKIQEQDLANQQAILGSLGVTFDEYGRINDYLTILEAKQSDINRLTDEYNSIVSAYNGSTDDQYKKQLQAEMKAYERSIQDATEDYKNTKNKMGAYDSLREDMEDLVDELDQIAQKEVQINIKKFRMEVEIRLEMGQAERDWNQFKRQVLEHTDIIKDTGFAEIFSDVKKSLDDLTSYYNVRGGKGVIQQLTEQLQNTRRQIQAIDETGKSAIYGDNKAQAIEDLKNDLKELQSQMENMVDAIDAIDQAYLKTIDDIADQFDKQIKDYEYVNDLINHNIDLMQLLYGQKNYDAMQNYYRELQKNNLNQIDSLRKQQEFWKGKWAEAAAVGDTQAAQKFKENYKKVIEELNEAIEKSAQTIQDKYINSIEKIFDTLDKKISNGKGTDYLSTEWELMNKNADQYLDTINSSFAIKQLQLKFQKEIDSTSALKGQRALKKLMDEQLGILKERDKITQYDVDRAEKLLEIEKNKIALQEAQLNKTSLRLKRDSQGNYIYEYMADQAEVDNAANNLLASQNDLYNFDKEHYQENLNEMLEAWKDFQEKCKAILQDVSLSEEQRVARIALLREQYGEYINNKTQQNLIIRTNLMDSAFMDIAAIYDTDVENYQNMSDQQKEILMGDLVPAWKSGLQDMTDAVAGNGGFIPTCEQAFDSIEEATQEYEQQLDNLANIAGIDLNDVRNGVDQLIYEFEDLIAVNDDLLDQMERQMSAIENLRSAAQALTDEYRSVYEAAATAVGQIQQFIQEQREAAAACNNTEQAYSVMRTNMIGADWDYAVGAAEANYQLANDLMQAANNMMAAADQAQQAAATYQDAQARMNYNTIVNHGQEHYRYARGATGAVYDYYDNLVSYQGGYAYRRGKTGSTYYTGHYDTGGYTGNWNSSEGRLAVLHEKQIVLNKDDTQNFLDGISILREIVNVTQRNIFSKQSGLSSLFNKQKFIKGQQQIQQNMNITANFPNVNTKKEIQDAFIDLANLAAQRIMKR